MLRKYSCFTFSLFKFDQIFPHLSETCSSIILSLEQQIFQKTSIATKINNNNFCSLVYEDNSNLLPYNMEQSLSTMYSLFAIFILWAISG